MIFEMVFKNEDMPWYNGDYPPSYKNQPLKLRNKAVKIANALLGEGMPEGVAIATGLKRAREAFTPRTRNRSSGITSSEQRHSRSGE